MIRTADQDDAQTCANILGNFFETTAWLPRMHTPAEDFAFLSGVIAQGGVWVAETDEGVVGFMAANGRELDHLYLAPHVQRHGIGTALINTLKADRTELTLWCFQQNVAALAFYGVHGFAEIARTDGDNAEKQPDVQLRWRAR